MLIWLLDAPRVLVGTDGSSPGLTLHGDEKPPWPKLMSLNLDGSAPPPWPK